ncbi:MAG: hypothetical protein LQ342_006898 [Letrouitia transgressa]|nr:MAG: hypothetical protein LQ342_006898 [Letrouitia transgressa]
MDLLQRLGRFLDRPGFPWKRVLVGFSVAQFIFERFLAARQYSVLKRTKPPKALEGEVSQEVFDKSQAYGRAKAKFGFVSSLYGLVQAFTITYYDVLPKLWAISSVWTNRFAPTNYRGEIVHTLIFFFTFNIITTIIDLPMSYYSHFVLEEKFGFNKQTVKLWITDMLKQQALVVILGAPLLSGFLAIIQKTGNSFFYYLFLFSIGIQMFAITIYPIAILPLFNKLSPLQEGPLKTGVEKLAKRLNFPLKELYVIDGSKRSAHSNAYFYGLPWKKHIVIYDTLIEQSETEEVVAVLSHELGHWGLSHTTKLFGISQANALAPLDTVIKLLMNVLSRKFEFQADEFAVKLGYSKELAKSLIKLQVQNLSTMDADWMYASYHFSHPILSERLGALGWKGGETKAYKQQSDVEKPSVASGREL